MTAEGATEQTFAVRVLQEHLANYNVFLEKPRLAAHAKKRGRPHRGGLGRGEGSFTVFKNDVERWLNQDRDPNAHFTTMIDLYALPRSFPGYDETAGTEHPCERVERLEFALSEEIADPRFIPYIQLHEFEALLLSEPAAFLSHYPDAGRQVEILERLCSSYESPERIDDGEHTAPSKRICTVIPRYARDKATAGPVIARRIGLATIRSKCPHFDQWVRKLEALGGTVSNMNAS